MEWTGRQLAVDKRGVLPTDMEGILMKMELDAAAWVESVRDFGRKFNHVAGSKDTLRGQARRRGQSRARGMTAAQGTYARSGG